MGTETSVGGLNSLLNTASCSTADIAVALKTKAVL